MPFNSRHQKITVWTQNGLNGEGFPAFSAPRVIDGRWEDRQVLVRNENNSEQTTSNARVYVGEEFSVGDYVLNGVSTDTTPPPLARKVIRFVIIPSVDARKSERVCYLD